MATTYDSSTPAAEAADPTFLAYQRAQGFAERAAGLDAAKQQSRLTADVQTGANALGVQQDNQVADNLAQYRAQGFGQSGVQAQDENRIRTQIAQQVQALLTGYQRSSQDVTDSMTNTMAQNAVDLQNERSAALARMTQAQATAGVGL